MSQLKHTPGPWKWSGRELEQDGAEYLDVIHTEVSCGSFCYGGCVDMTISDADKRLIAAAPELLEALTILLDNVVHAMPQVAHLAPVVNARDAIAKATGAE